MRLAELIAELQQVDEVEINQLRRILVSHHRTALRSLRCAIVVEIVIELRIELAAVLTFVVEVLADPVLSLLGAANLAP